MAQPPLQRTLEGPQGVASVGSPIAPPDTSLAQIITAGAKVGEGILRENRKDEIEEELKDLGTEVFAAREGKDLENATERFKELQIAQEQGQLTDSFVNIQAEKIMKEVIGKNPSFAPEIRTEAARILGFDPTGSEIQALFGKSGRTTPRRPLTEDEKRLMQAERISAATGVPQQTVLSTFAKAEWSDLLVKTQVNQAKLGQATTDNILNASLDGIDSAVNDAMGNLFIQIQQGGVQSPELTIAAIQVQKQAHWQRTRQAMAESGLNPSSSQLSDAKKIADDRWAPVEELARSGALDEILKRQKTSLQNSAGILGFELFPTLASLNQAAGSGVAQEFLKTLSDIKDPNQFPLLQKFVPGLAKVAANSGELANRTLESYERIMGIAPRSNKPEEAGMDDVLFKGTAKTISDPEVRLQRLQGVIARGHTFKDFSDYAQEGARARMIPEEVKYVKDQFAVHFEPLLARISAAAKENPQLILTVENGQIRATGRNIPGRISRADVLIPQGLSVDVPGTLSGDIKRVNAVGRMVQNGLAADLGQNPGGFMERTLNKISTLQEVEEQPNESDATSKALSAFRANPSQETLDVLRKLDPELVAEAERKFLSNVGGSDSE